MTDSSRRLRGAGSFRRSVSGPVASIEVGDGLHVQEFFAHKSLLCDCSQYFKAALDGHFAEGQKQKIVLDDEDPVIFGTFVAWLYQGQLDSQGVEAALDGSERFDYHIAKLIVFADKRSITELENDAITMLLSFSHRAGPVERRVVECIYEIPHVLQISNLLCVLASEEVHFRQSSRMGNMTCYPPEYLAIMVRILLEPVESRIHRSLKFFIDDLASFCNAYHTHQESSKVCSSLTDNAYVPYVPPETQRPSTKRPRILAAGLTTTIEKANIDNTNHTKTNYEHLIYRTYQQCKEDSTWPLAQDAASDQTRFRQQTAAKRSQFTLNTRYMENASSRQNVVTLDRRLHTIIFVRRETVTIDACLVVFHNIIIASIISSLLQTLPNDVTV
ncbi:hypothetical protein E4T38_00697 [Aureobasidium subglaciale]|nr:hypothetical protein E4T38_00697 [Aureobasidium subglaciale]KAI5231109.1 hypothetical protein E4T40_00698 [Aureobasidium subglaciale]KAI5234146.1 hypothetical protein E4T41_00696 [Aureobasidium subglaciale]KAI5267492.1 hypothetical protein E4T46_00696 [Aureobasidium subglaciale]